MMDEQALKDFLKKFKDNRHTEREHALFIHSLHTAPIEQVQDILEEYLRITDLHASAEFVQYPALLKKIEARLNELGDEEIQAEPIIKRWPSLIRRIAAVAAVFFIASLSVYFWINRDLDKQMIVKNKNESLKPEIAPGGNKAMLTLSDGSKIVLDTIKDGVMTTQAGIRIRKTANGQIIYDASTSKHESRELSYNIISTPRGGQYHIILPDGTKVWLNAASSLKFPISFSAKERKVELTGEAYFEVAKVTNPSVDGRAGSRIPFKVSSGDQIVEVLGTHFNINAYSDEATINTTLLEGSVKVMQVTTHQSQLLTPGQQAKVGATIQVSTVDATQAIAWKNGYFIFSYENIESVMRRISRWYNVDIKYEGTITDEKFVGSISRFENVSQVLEMLELTGSAHFKIESPLDDQGREERRIVVMP